VKKFEEALNEGVEFYKSNDRVNKYQSNLNRLILDFRKYYGKVKPIKKLNKDQVLEFFVYCIKLLQAYTWMDFEYTDKAFGLQDKNKEIAKI